MDKSDVITKPKFFAFAGYQILLAMGLRTHASGVRSSANTKHSLLDLPNKTKKTTGDRAFFAAAPTLWNALTDELRASSNLKIVMARLKTHYFKLAFSFWPVVS